MRQLGCSASVFCVVLWLSVVCAAAVHDVLCRNGSGVFEAHFGEGVKAGVGPKREGQLSERACQASIRWGDHQIVVASDAVQIDLESFGVYMDGLGPIAAFQVKQSDALCCMTYQIYSLEVPPRLRRTISGGQSFRAADTDLDGLVEIWTDDAAAVDGFEGFPAREMDFVPSVVLRFDSGRLLDVSIEFQAYFDAVITKLRTDFNNQLLQDFKASDGRLEEEIPLSTKPPGRLQALRVTKLRVLEIVWAYLYSGREQEAWRALAAMWPPDDVERIRSAVIRVHAGGIMSQVDGESSTIRSKRKVKVYRQSQVRPAQPIMVRCYPLCGPAQRPAKSELRVNLIIDSAGKVRSVQPVGSKTDADIALSAREWKFIPAFRRGRSVASRLKGSVSLRQ